MEQSVLLDRVPPSPFYADVFRCLIEYGDSGPSGREIDEGGRGVGRFIYVGDCEPGKVRASFALIPDPTGGVASAPVVLIRRYVAIDVKNRSLNKFSANLYLKSMRRKIFL